MAEEAVLSVGDRKGQKEEAEVRNGGIEITPSPPHQYGQRMQAADRPVRKEVGWRRKK